MSVPDPQLLWRRATLLAQQGRGELAQRELRQLLTIDPGFGPAHALLSQLLIESDPAAARREAEAAITADPGHPLGHYALARVLDHQEEFEAAAAAIDRAIELDPEDPDARAVLAQIRLQQKRHADALAAADAGLALDPQHIGCLNLRSLALVRLGRQQEAHDTLDAALAHDPDNPLTHQARGFALLHRGDPAGALRHFQEALRRDPTLDGARAGLVEALKARNPVYRVVLSWFLWMERFTGARQRQILLYAWATMFVGRRLVSAIDGMEWVATALGSIWFGAVLFTTCAVPFFNLLLLVHPLGRHALPRRQRVDALLLGGALLLAATVIVLDLADVGRFTAFASLFAVGWLLPVASIGAVGDFWPRRAMQLFSAALLVGYGWWAWRLEAMLTQADSIVATGGAGWSQQDTLALKTAIDQHVGLHSTFLLAIMLSTWFVAMVPKRWRKN